MGSYPTSQSEVLDDAIAWIQSLDATAYAPGSTWRAISSPRQLLQEGRVFGSLAFDVWLDEGDHDAAIAGEGECSPRDEWVQPLVVEFLFRARRTPGERRADWSLAHDAAEHVLQALCARSAGVKWQGRRTRPPVVSVPEDLGGVPGTDWLHVRVECDVPIWFVYQPYWKVAPSFSGTLTVGSVLTGSAGAVVGAVPTYEWIVDGTGTGTSTPYTILAADAGDAILYRGTATNTGGTSTSDSASAVVKPYLSGAPVVSGTNTVGSTLTATAPVWLGATSTAGEWTVGGTGTGATSLTYVVQVGDEGLDVAYAVQATNPGGTTGPTSSNAFTIRPYWSVQPVINAGSEPWPGGTVTATPGTVSGETSGPAGEWLVDGSGTGDTDTSYNPQPSDVGQPLVYEEQASNAGGASLAQSAPVTVQRVRGITRPTITADYPVGTAIVLPATNVTLIVEGEISAAESNARIAGIGSLTDYLRFTRASTTDSITATVSIGGVVANRSLALTGTVTLGSKFFAMVSLSGGQVTGRAWSEATGLLAPSTTPLSGSLSSGSNGLQLFNWNSSADSAGSLEAKVLSRALSLAEFQAVYESPIGIASLDDDPDVLAELYPATATASDGDTITTAAEITGGASIVAGTARLIDGGLNAATT